MALALDPTRAQVTMATGAAERKAALEMLEARAGGRRVAVGGDKGYDVHEFVEDVRELGVTPHVAQNHRNRRSAIDARTTRHAGHRDQSKETQAGGKSVWMAEHCRLAGFDRSSRAVGRGRKSGKSSPDPTDLFADRVSQDRARVRTGIFDEEHAIFLLAQPRHSRGSKG
jgi:IS5 family transposase